jgi:hypothetical protein
MEWSQGKSGRTSMNTCCIASRRHEMLCSARIIAMPQISVLRAGCRRLPETVVNASRLRVAPEAYTDATPTADGRFSCQPKIWPHARGLR